MVIKGLVLNERVFRGLACFPELHLGEVGGDGDAEELERGLLVPFPREEFCVFQQHFWRGELFRFSYAVVSAREVSGPLREKIGNQ